MIRSGDLRTGVVLVQWFLAFMGPKALGLSDVRVGNQDCEVLPLSAKLAPGAQVVKQIHTSVRWDGRDYPAGEGIDVLMEVILDPGTDPGVRAKALDRLKRLGSWLRGAPSLRSQGGGRILHIHSSARSAALA